MPVGSLAPRLIALFRSTTAYCLDSKQNLTTLARDTTA